MSGFDATGLPYMIDAGETLGGWLASFAGSGWEPE